MSIFSDTPIAGLKIIDPQVWEDNRGHFYEAYNQKEWRAAGIEDAFVQDNQSLSRKGAIRGLHFQLQPFAQVKVVRVLKGTILDVAVDIRRSSPTFGQHFSIELSSENRTQLYIPGGFAHGFSVLSEEAIVLYKCDQFYNKAAESGVRFDDSKLNIDWKVPADVAFVSEKDLNLPDWNDLNSNFE